MCAHCGGEMRLLAYIFDSKVVEKILAYLGVPTKTMPLSPARWPAQISLFDNLDALDAQGTDQSPSWPTHPSQGQNNRGPPKPEALSDSGHDHNRNNHADDTAGVIFRKVNLGTQSERGSRFIERIHSAIQSLQAQSRQILPYLCNVLESALSNDPPPSFLPLPA